jgi:hypothetical protein
MMPAFLPSNFMLPFRIAATGTADEGSIMIFIRSHISRMAFKNGFLRHGNDFIHILAEDGECPFAECGAQAVSDCFSGIGKLPLPRLLSDSQASFASSGSVPINADFRFHMAGGDGCAAHQPASADRGEDHIQAGNLFEQFFCRRSLPGDYPYSLSYGWMNTAPVFSCTCRRVSSRAFCVGAQKVMSAP